MPTKTEYVVGQELDLTGMTVILHYDDGTSETVTDGFTASGFDPDSVGEQEVMIQYVSYIGFVIVNVRDRIRGDVNENGTVDDSEAIYLLYHTFFPEQYPVFQSCDYNGDGKVNDSDAIYLLYYTFFPDSYPLALPPDHEE